VQEAVRKCLRAFMEITEADPLPQPLPNGMFWEPIMMIDPRTGESIASRRLRPDWDKSWADNESAWLLDVVNRIRTDAREYTEYNFGSISQERLTKALSSVWKGLIKKWNLQTATAPTKDEKSRQNKKNQRKTMVSDISVTNRRFAAWC
ncbi:hypothetical protein OH77DRAFT_1411375, partial [Trametes cingulata]